MIAGTGSVLLPFAQGTLVPAPAIVLPFATDSAGKISLAAPWQGGPSGVSVYLQYWIADSGGPAGFTASNGLRFTVP